jgi:hypothetical protein
MKKVLSTVLTCVASLSLVGCATTSTTTSSTSATAEAVIEDGTKSEGVMTYAEYCDAATDTEVTIEAYVQAKQGWWEDNGVGQATVYTQDQDGAYFLYNLPMSEEDYDKLTEGTKIKVTGYKSEWSGEVEITDGTFEIEEGTYVAEPVDVTDLLADEDELIKHQNEKVTFKGLTVSASEDADGNEVAYLYNYDGSGTKGDDLYFNVELDGTTYTFTVESYLCGEDTDVYKAVEALKVGDTIDCEGFLYWYNGVNPHITTVTVK